MSKKTRNTKKNRMIFHMILLVMNIGMLVSTSKKLEKITIEKNVPIKNLKHSDTFENKKVGIDYYENPDGTFDIIIEALDSYNLSSEFEVEVNNNQFYLVGRKQDQAWEFYERNQERFIKDGIPFQWQATNDEGRLQRQRQDGKTYKAID